MMDLLLLTWLVQMQLFCLYRFDFGLLNSVDYTENNNNTQKRLVD